MAYADKRDGKATGAFVGERPKGKKKRRFKTMQADDQESAWAGTIMAMALKGIRFDARNASSRIKR